MITIPAPDSDSRRFNLINEVRAVRKSPTFPTARFATTSWIELSPVTSIALKPEMSSDPELASFINADRNRFRYDYVRLRCTFRASADQQFEKAWLEVALSPTAVNGNDGAVVWSMTPREQYDILENTTAAKIGAKLKFVSSEVSESEKANIKLFLIRAYRESTSSPFWEIARTELSAIEGTVAFHMVVRSPADVDTTGSVKLSTMIGKRKFWLFREDQPHPDTPVQLFSLHA